VAGCIWIRAGVGDGSVGRIAIDSRARNGAIGAVANRSCGKGFPSRTSGIARISPTGLPTRARNRDGARKRRSIGGRRTEAPKLSKCRRASVRSVKYYAKGPRSTSAAQDCRSARCRIWRPCLAGRPHQFPLGNGRSGGTSPALAGAARNSRNAAALERLRILASVSHADGPHTAAYPSVPSELNLRKMARQEGDNRGALHRGDWWAGSTRRVQERSNQR
jgi:hypothetical protein